jgi:lipooligosaccharide transport system permease protein
MTLPLLTPGALAFCAQRLTSYRHFWRSSLISSVLEPALFLASMGLTLGIYDAVLATPTRVTDLIAGHLLYVTFRLTTAATLFLGVLVLFGAAGSWLVVLAVPAAVLTGLAFAAPVSALAASLDNDSGFAALQRFVVIPMFLFSGTFFPVSALPAFFEWIAYATPLWHGVSLARGLTLGTLSGGAGLLHVGYLLAWAVAGVLLARRTYRRRLGT